MKRIGPWALLPLIGMLLGPICHNAAIPFILGWTAIWIVITSAVMGLVYWRDPARRAADAEEER